MTAPALIMTIGHSTRTEADVVALLAAYGVGGVADVRKSPNTAWRHPSLRAYADHMGTPVFRRAIDALLAFASDRLVAVLCAEAQWWQCHRQLVADALVARGVEVRHIMSPASAPLHTLTSFARVTGDGVTYPGLIC